MNNNTFILGAGMTGLAASFASGLPVFETAESPGGICSSYYFRPDEKDRMFAAPGDGEAYRFEIGGGHWIFGADPIINKFLSGIVLLKYYNRSSSVYFRERDLYVPYPIQNHLSYLDQGIVLQALVEMSNGVGSPHSMKGWLNKHFGGTLCNLFFFPFHELYTAGLYDQIAPQDTYKSPVDIKLAIQGALSKTAPVGYNATFAYPNGGLDALARKIADRCDVRYNKRVVQIDIRSKELVFADGSGEAYDSIISTLPLNVAVEMTDLELEARPDPHTSVLVLNIGAKRGPQCPDEHWLYNPDALSGFHRVGFYSNVDRSFLPASARKDRTKVSIYVEKGYPGGQKPSDAEIRLYADEVVRELRDWEFIGDADVVDPTWIDVAYTWSWPGSGWKENAIKELEKHDIFQVGRYARWTFHGIADSTRTGLLVGSAMRPI